MVWSTVTVAAAASACAAAVGFAVGALTRVGRSAVGARRDRLQAVIEQMPFGVLVVDGASARVRLANAEAARLFGHGVGQEPVWERPDGLGVVDDAGVQAGAEAYALHQALAERRRIGPKLQPYRRGDGQVVTLEVSAAPVLDPDGEVELAVVAFQDVTERLKAEEALRRAAAVEESVAQFRLIADSAPVLLWISALGGRRQFVNRAYVDFLGVGFDEAVGFDWRNALHPDDLNRILEEQSQGEASLQPFSLEARYRRHDGQWRWVRSLSQPRWDEGGGHAGFVGVAYDVTEAKQAEAALLQINELLEERVAAALRDKAVAEAALAHAQKLEALGRLTGGVAHDFNNLLTVVIGALDLMLKHPEDEARRTRMGQAALAAARRGERLTQQLLAFSRRQALRPERVDLAAMVEEVEPILRRAVGEQVRFRLDRRPGAEAVRVDAAQFEAALLNLVVNAVDATPVGGEIRVEFDRTTVSDGELPELAGGDYVRVRVSDTGEGMATDILAQAFEPFFTTKEPGKGTGLGLSQVYGFARQSGGFATIDSAPGEGATVSLYLKPDDGPAQTLPAPATPVLLKAGPLDVLLVEDDPEVAEVAAVMLQDLGHRVRRCSDAAAALPIVEADDPIDILVTDVVMPGELNGVQLALKATALRPELRVLLCSGYARDALDDALSKARWPLLRKPYTKDELAAMLEAQMASAPT